jgi:YVTN family beta-propeller protein
MTIPSTATTNQNPINGAFNVTNTNPTTGVITGTVSATDPDGDTLTFSGPASTPKATITINPTTGVVTYTPTAAGLNTAAAGGADTFNVTVSDGHGGTVNVPVSITIPASAATVRTISFGSNVAPTSLAFNQAGTKAYLANQSKGTVTVIDTASGATLQTLTFGTSSLPTYAATAPNGNIYVTNKGTGTVSVIETVNDTVVATIPVGGNPIEITFASNGIGYVATGSTNSVVRIDTATNTVLPGTVSSPSVPVAVRLNPAGDKLYVANQNAHKVSVYSTSTSQLLAEIQTGNLPTEIQFNANGTRAYVTSQGSAQVNVIDTSNDTVIANIPVGNHPVGMQIVGTRAYVVNFNGSSSGDIHPGSVSVIDLTTNTVVGTIPIGPGPVYATLSPNGTEMWIADSGGAISIIHV